MWSWAKTAPLPKLDDPPVVEVICGLCFPALDIDPVVAGAYWHERKAEYPHRQLHPAVEQGFGFIINAAPRMRVWMLAEDQSLLLQVQSDRFYLNWRRTDGGAAYPRFSGENGLCKRSLREFESFSAFCTRTIGRPPVADRIELGKVDHMLEGQYWNGLPDLAALLPALAPVLGLSEGKDTATTLRFQDQLGSVTLKVAIDTTLTMKPGRDPVRGLRIDTVVSMPLHGRATEDVFIEANGIVNSVFATLIPEAQRNARFMRQKGEQ